MTVPRALLVLFMLVIIGVAIVAIRQESARTANRIQTLHRRKITLEQTLWTKELELAKLRGPEAIRRRAAELGSNVVSPGVPPSSDRRRSGS
ncbi:MAG: hypothetical protein ACE5E1_01410 [Phycisphaerae bacterium]